MKAEMEIPSRRLTQLFIQEMMMTWTKPKEGKEMQKHLNCSCISKVERAVLCDRQKLSYERRSEINSSDSGLSKWKCRTAITDMERALRGAGLEGRVGV